MEKGNQLSSKMKWQRGSEAQIEISHKIERDRDREKSQNRKRQR